MAMKTENRQLIQDLFASVRLAVLSTQQGDQPCSHLVAFGFTPDLKHLVFATERGTRKFLNISTNPRVSMLIDDRANDPSDFEKAIAVTAAGKAREVPCRPGTLYHDLYLRRHPSLSGFVSSPTCALLCVEVENYMIVSRFRQIQLIPGPEIA